MMAQPDFPGLYHLEFTDGSKRVVRIESATFTVAGLPVYLIGEDGTFYNYDNIICLRKD